MSEIRPATVQGTEVSYELHTLGWKAFQDLCATVVTEIWGQTVQVYFSSHDSGRDGAFNGKWERKAGEVFDGTFTVQCKFTSAKNKPIRLAHLTDEIEKARRLAERGLAKNYILMTNASLIGSEEITIRQQFEKLQGIEKFAAYGGEWISKTIRESPRLRMLVPRVYGLGDLSQILDERAFTQAREILSSLGDDLAKFVITEPHRKSAKALAEHGFVLLLGEPACGKSTIAAALAVGAIDVWGASTIKVRDADDFVRHWNPNEPKQFFWVDDAFGVTQFDWASVAAWNRAFGHLHAAIRKGARVLFTSRDYIYRTARRYLKETALPIIQEAQVVINVEQLSKEEKQQILYNHIRLGNQPREFRKSIKPFLPRLANAPRLLPELARRLGNPFFTKNLVLSESGLREFIEKPLELLMDVIRTADAPSRAALALVFMRGGSLPSPVTPNADEARAVELIGGDLGGLREALNSLKGSLVLQILQNGIYLWRFKHPTVRDAFAQLVAEDPELLDIYLAGTPTEDLLSETTCGDVELEGVKVIVPKDRFRLIIHRLDQLDSRKDEGRGQLHRFLAYRCDREFLQSYLREHPQFLESLRVGSYLSAVSDVAVFVAFHEHGLLPEDQRRRFVLRVAELAVETPDAYFVRNEEIRGLFTTDEFGAIMRDVRTNLLPNLTDVIFEWRSNYDGTDESPGEYFSNLVHELETYREELSRDEEAVLLINKALDRIEKAVSELESEGGGGGDSDDYEGGYGSSLRDSGDRSVFEDVDQ